MYLVDIADAHADTSNERFVIHVIAFICLCLRDAISLFSRLHIADEEISKLKELCLKYHRACALFFSGNPTSWTIGHVIPVHTQQMVDKYGLGLGLNSMEGREAKHVFIARYSKNTIFQTRWEQVLRHEFISLI